MLFLNPRGLFWICFGFIAVIWGCANEWPVEQYGDRGLTYDDGEVSELISNESDEIDGRRTTVHYVHLPAHDKFRTAGLWQSFEVSRIQPYKGIKFSIYTSQKEARFFVGFYSSKNNLADRSLLFLADEVLSPPAATWTDVKYLFKDVFRLDTNLQYPINSIIIKNYSYLFFFIERIGTNQPESEFKLGNVILFGRNDRYSFIRPFWNR